MAWTLGHAPVPTSCRLVRRAVDLSTPQTSLSNIRSHMDTRSLWKIAKIKSFLSNKATLWGWFAMSL